MTLEHIKANGEYYYPVKTKHQHPTQYEGCYKDVCFIKKLWFGRWQVDLHDSYSFDRPKRMKHNSNQIPNVRLILYPSGIEEIRYLTIK